MTCRGVSYHEAKAIPPRRRSSPTARAVLSFRSMTVAFRGECRKPALCETFANKGVLNLQNQYGHHAGTVGEPTSPPIITDKNDCHSRVRSRITSPAKRPALSAVLMLIPVKSLWAFILRGERSGTRFQPMSTFTLTRRTPGACRL